MKRVLILLAAIAVVLLPTFVFAGFADGENSIILQERLEVSKDGTNWYNYSAEENPGGQTLSVNAGSTVYFRLKTWNEGKYDATNIEYTGTYSSPQYLDAVNMFSSAGTQDDLDGDTIDYHTTGFDPNAGTATFGLYGAESDGTIDSGVQSGGVSTVIKSNTPDQTVITVTVQITAADSDYQIVWWKKLIDKALADDSATTQVRMLVLNPAPAAAAATLPVTGPKTMDVTSSAAFILGLISMVFIDLQVKKHRALR